MAKVTGPLLSLDAKGTFCKSLVFTTGKLGQRVRGYRSHADSKSDSQLLWRSFYRSVVDFFSLLSYADRQFFDEEAHAQNMTGFNLYSKKYLVQKPTEVGASLVGFSQLGDLTN